MQALDLLVRQGKALYIGISNYDAKETAEALKILDELGTPLLIHQPSYSMLNRWIEDGLQNVLEKNGVGSIAFVPLAQGLLTSKYLNGVPEGSRASKETSLSRDSINEEMLSKITQLNELASERNQSLAQMSLAWVLREGKVTSALIGASKVEQIEENVKALNNLEFTNKEISRIDAILSKK